MRHTRTTAAGLLAAGLLLTACSSSTTASPAQRLADLDGGTRPASDYQTALDAWSAKCAEPPTSLAGYVDASVNDLAKNGVSETEYSVLTHLDQSTPGGAALAKCEDIAASYLVLREQR